VLFLRYKLRNRKGNILILEFVALIPMFFLLMLILFDFLQLYTASITMQQASQAAISEISFAGKAGEEKNLVANGVKKANAIISYAVTQTPDSFAHTNYKYELIQYNLNNQTNTYPLNDHINPSSFMFLSPDRQMYTDHFREIWGFKISHRFTYTNLAFINNQVFSFNIEATQYMGILRGNSKGH
jgi:hypothetical protein